MNWNPSGQDRVVATGDAVACEFGKGLALLHLKSNTYYSLNGVGAYIWEQVQEPRSIADISNAVLARYNVDPERCKADVEGLLKGLTEAGLVMRLRNEELV